jgi:hypothetical protein
MKTKNVTVNFEYTSLESLEKIIDKLKFELMQGKEYFEDVVSVDNYKNRYLHFIQEYKQKRNFRIENDVIIIKSKI